MDSASQTATYFDKIATSPTYGYTIPSSATSPGLSLTISGHSGLSVADQFDPDFVTTLTSPLALPQILTLPEETFNMVKEFALLGTRLLPFLERGTDEAKYIADGIDTMLSRYAPGEEAGILSRVGYGMVSAPVRLSSSLMQGYSHIGDPNYALHTAEGSGGHNKNALMNTGGWAGGAGLDALDSYFLGKGIQGAYKLGTRLASGVSTMGSGLNAGWQTMRAGQTGLKAGWDLARGGATEMIGAGQGLWQGGRKMIGGAKEMMTGGIKMSGLQWGQGLRTGWQGLKSAASGTQEMIAAGRSGLTRVWNMARGGAQMASPGLRQMGLGVQQGVTGAVEGLSQMGGAFKPLLKEGLKGAGQNGLANTAVQGADYLLTGDPINPTEIMAAALSNGIFGGLGGLHQIGTVGKMGYNAGAAMNQYRATQLLEGKEIKQDELGLNALVGFATGNWGEVPKFDKAWQGLRIILGQVSWDKVTPSDVEKLDSKLPESSKNNKKEND